MTVNKKAKKRIREIMEEQNVPYSVAMRINQQEQEAKK